MEAAEFDATLKDLETRLDRLKALYEMYFQGIERIEPAVPRKQVERMFEVLRRDQPRATHLRFRYQSLLQRYTTLQTYWRRVTRQIEEGTYKRDLQRLAHKNAQKAARRAPPGEREDTGEKGVYELDIDVDTESAADLSSLLDDPELEAAIAGLERRPAPVPTARFAPPSRQAPSASTEPAGARAGADAAPSAPAAPVKVATFGKPSERRRPEEARPAPPPPAAAPPAPRPAPAAPDDARMKRIYEDYVAARRSNNERVDNVKYETLQRSIEQMMPKLKEKHQGRAIDFEVVVRDGRVGLKPVPK